MSQDFKPVLVRDSRLNDITDQLAYAVQTGASQNTYQKFPATASSASNLSFNVQIPSESVVVSRDILINATVNFEVEITNVPPNVDAFCYGATDAFQAFPLNSLFTTVAASINNTNVSVNLQDVLPQLLRMIDPKDLHKYQGMTPCLPDSFYKYFSDADGKPNDPLADFTNASYDNELLPRGAYPLRSYVVQHYINNVLQPNPSVTSTALTDRWVIQMSVNITEPLFLSPFLFGGRCEYNNQGFVGINSINLVMNVDSTLKRFWSTKSTGFTYAVRLSNVQPFDASLLLNFLSSQPTDLIKARNIVPYHDFPRYITGVANTSILQPNAIETVTCQNIQLNQIPDMFIICARKPMSQQTAKDSSTFLGIRKISVNFNNASGLLSSASTQDLWRISKANGSTQNWYEFYGYASVSDDGILNPANIPGVIKTSGSLLVLNPAKDLSLPAYLSNGSIGQYSFQINVDVVNTENNALAPEVVIIAVNSGVFSTIAGSSAIYTGLLTKQMVLDVQQSSEQAVSSAQYDRLVGGSMSNRISAALKGMLKPLQGVMRSKVQEAACGGAKSAGVASGGMARKLDALSF